MSGAGIPPGLEAMLAGGGSPLGQGPMAPALPPGAPGTGMENPTTAGGEAVAQSDVAKAGLEAWQRCQGQPRCSGDDLKAMIMYVLTEGQDAPEAQAMSQYLQQHGVNLPGVGPQNGGQFEGPGPDDGGGED